MIFRITCTLAGLAMIAAALYFDRDGLLFLAGYSVALGRE